MVTQYEKKMIFPAGISPEWSMLLGCSMVKIYYKDSKPYGIISHRFRGNNIVINGGTIGNQPYTFSMFKRMLRLVALVKVGYNVTTMTVLSDRFSSMVARLNGQTLAGGIVYFKRINNV